MQSHDEAVPTLDCASAGALTLCPIAKSLSGIGPSAAQAIHHSPLHGTAISGGIHA
jgi:hypothetical protein